MSWWRGGWRADYLPVAWAVVCLCVAGCGGTTQQAAPTPTVGQVPVAEDPLQACAQSHATDGLGPSPRAVSAFATTAGSVARWQEKRTGQPSTFSSWPTDQRVIVCYFDGVFTRPADRAPFTRVMFFVSADGSVALSDFGSEATLPVGDHP